MTVWETQTQLSQSQCSNKTKIDNNDEYWSQIKTNETPKATKMHKSESSSQPARKPRSPSALSSHPSAPKVGKLNQNTPEPFFNAKSPQPGDLVMGTAGDIHHPAAEPHGEYIIYHLLHRALVHLHQVEQQRGEGVLEQLHE